MVSTYVKEFMKEMTSGGVAGFAPENVITVVDNVVEEDEECISKEVEESVYYIDGSKTDKETSRD